MAKILIVDDEHMTAEMLATFLKLMGHEAVDAFSSKQLDIMLPDVNGLEMCRQLRSNATTTHVPIIMISAYSPPLTREATEAGANAYLVKPISLQSLKNALTSVGIGA